ncbi:hypothetical protein ACVWW3_005123 [Bradyrhizobium sp. LM2.9]
MAAISTRLTRPRMRTGFAAPASPGKGSLRKRQTSMATKIASSSPATIAVCSQMVRVVQKKSTPCRKPTNSGGSPSGLSAPPTLATRMMKKMTTWTLWRRGRLARIKGRIRIMAAPVVPTTSRHQRAEREDAGIRRRRRLDIARDENAPGHDIEREQQHDETEIFGEHGVDECRQRRHAPGQDDERGECQQRPGRGDLAVMMVPKPCKQQRAERDRQQEAAKGQRIGPAHRRAVEPGRRPCVLRQQHDQDRGDEPAPAPNNKPSRKQ